MAEKENATLDILHVEDNPADAELVRSTLSEAGLVCKMTVVKSGKEFKKALNEKKFDLILSDFSLPSFSGTEAFQIARSLASDTPFVFVSGTLGEDAAIQCLIDGATDYVLKTKMARLVPAAKRAVQEAEAHMKFRLAEKLREMALEDLRISEARFRGVLESAPDSALIIDSEGKIAFANPQTEKMFGFSGEELVGKPLDTLVPERFRKVHSQYVVKYGAAPHARTMNSGIELYAKRKDGTEFPADIMLSPLKVDHDISILAMIRDITASKESEKALREREELFRSIYEGSPVAIINVDPQGRIIRCNVAATKLLGYSAAELQEMHFNDFTHKDDKQIGTLMLGDLAEGKTEIINFDKRYLRKNGEVIRVQLTVSAVRNEDKSVRYAVAIMEDITEKWQAEESLRRSEERYRSLVDNARDAIYTLSLGAIILSLNPAFETLTGWKREEWIGRSMSDLIHPDDRQKAIDSFRRTLRGDLPDAIQYRILKKSGEYAIGEFNTAKFTLENGSAGVLGIARDVTAQIALEEQLRQAQKMESIGTLAGGIAHDFNNILGIIIGYASLTMKHVKDDKRLSSNIRSMELAAERGVNLVRQLLVFARKQERVLQTLNVSDVITDIYRMISETFPKVISVNTSLSEDTLVIYGDQTELHQAILNLCVNARDAMMDRIDGSLPGGTLSISTAMVEGKDVRSTHASASSDQYIRVVVSDTGMGMDETTQKRIFEPFFTTKEKGKGTGLGLSTVYGIVSSYNGFIELSSRVGAGTTFTILLPARKAGPAEPAADVSQRGEALDGNETILVVEDEPGLRELLYDILTSRGYKVLTAEDGQRALAVFLDNRDIDLLVSDIGLPKVGGLDLFQAVKKINADIEVILVSGFVDESDRERMTKSGVSTFIQKPYQPTDILKRIREVLDRR